MDGRPTRAGYAEMNLANPAKQQRRPSAGFKAPGKIESKTRHGAAALTQREVAVLELVCLGLADKQVAAELNIKRRTARQRLSRAMRVLDCVSRTSAAVLWHEYVLRDVVHWTHGRSAPKGRSSRK